MTPTLTNPRLAAIAAFGITSLGAISFAAAHPTDPQPQPQTLPAPVPANIYGTGTDGADDSYGPYADDGRYADDGHWNDDVTEPDYDADDDGVLEHVEIDYRHYDSDRDGILGPTERTAYWTHMFDMGKLGGDFTRADKLRLARIAYLFDRNGDGRLTGGERAAMSRLIRGRRSFLELDRNRDNNVTRREARLTGGYGGGWGGYGNRRYLDGRAAPYGWSSIYWAPFRRPDPTPSNLITARFEILDRNHNGRVSWNEVETHLIQTFRRGVRP
ncbi:MAG TPA: hypothetical protein VK698_15995 [Kofleriaceae bacterium]|nr:hypothetical protein [Kofleriaceae bacterium]